MRKKAVIIGGTGGIGYAIAKGFVAAGYDVIVSGIDAPEVKAVYNEFSHMGLDTLEYSFDATDKEQTDSFVQAVKEKWGTVDVLINCQGIHHKIKTEDESRDSFARMMDINVVSVFNTCKSIFPLMKTSGNACIINMASMGSFIGLKDAAAYTTSKGAVAQFTKACAVDWAEYGIRSNAIAPGWILTPLSEDVLSDPKYGDPILKRIPLNRFGTPEDIAEVAVFIASEGGRYINGAIIPVDGGALASI